VGPGAGDAATAAARSILEAMGLVKGETVDLRGATSETEALEGGGMAHLKPVAAAMGQHFDAVWATFMTGQALHRGPKPSALAGDRICLFFEIAPRP